MLDELGVFFVIFRRSRNTMTFLGLLLFFWRCFFERGDGVSRGACGGDSFFVGREARHYFAVVVGDPCLVGARNVRLFVIRFCAPKARDLCHVLGVDLFCFFRFLAPRAIHRQCTRVSLFGKQCETPQNKNVVDYCCPHVNREDFFSPPRSRQPACTGPTRPGGT